ncbi:helix-turn-helix transcriptional regulator [Thioalkalivibrio halophilus]|uniref:AlpA family transcriptional regulator n=1 Tax=Thioalkalivibrio halophilus TaxID=252474 RepID=A0A1V2ZZU3_9GAMM|nr:AlpA family phage regulatory protein [Thioalkalivibrio halophilus]OOC10586.1 AlpA family transcriptional regulator [Thioalkalivibrio halophilus]
MYNDTDTATPERLLRLRDVLDRTSMSRSAWYALIQRGEAPAPVKVGAAARWPESAVDAWIRRQVES